MASITCEINIANEFRDTKFFLFQEVPQAKNGPSGEVFSNIYQVTEKNQAQRDGSSTIQFQMDNTFYALFGSKSGQGGDTRVNTSSFKKVKLGPDGTVVAITDKAGAFVWDDASSAGKKAPNEGGFQFITDDTIPTDTDKNYIGVGAADPDHQGKVVPIATYLAEPSLKSMLYPKLTYYVSTGDWQPGQLVDRNLVGKYVKIDFEGSRIPTATVILKPNGDWVDDHNLSSKNGVKIEAGDFGH